MKLRVLATRSAFANLALLVIPPSAYAHAKFFASDASPFDWHRATSPGALLAVTAGLSLAILIRLVEPFINNPRSRRCLVRWVCEKLAPLSPAAVSAPVIARVALGLTLIAATATGTLLSPQATTLPHAAAAMVGMQCVLGMCLVLGIQIRTCAMAVLGLALVRSITEGPLGLFERADILGLSLFVVATRGRAWRPRLSASQLNEALVGSWLLRVCCGIALFVTAFTEKLGSSHLTESVLAHHQLLDLSRILPISQHTFIMGAAGIEILLAALIVLLPLAQLSPIGIGLPFIATLPLFGLPELVGHLPIYGAVAVLFLMAINTQTATVVCVLIPTRRRTRLAIAAQPLIGSQFPWRHAKQSITPAFTGPQFSFTASFSTVPVPRATQSNPVALPEPPRLRSIA